MKQAAIRVVQCIFAFVILAVAFAGRSEADDYRLAPGDVLELTSTGQAGLRHRTTIGVDGTATFPLAGTLKVAGSTLDDVRTRLQDTLATRLMRQRGEDGREYTTVLTPEQIVITIAEYRPIYLLGDIAKPGEQAFRPGLSVRQAVALAGGYDVMRFRMSNPFLELADVKGENETLWIQYVREQATITRLQAELEGKPNAPDLSALDELPAPRKVIDDVKRIEADLYASRLAAYQQERQHMVEAVKKDDGRVAVLAEQEDKERSGTDADNAELQRNQQLLSRGQVPITRVIDARRTSLLSATRVLQTMAQRNTVERQRDDTVLKLKQLDDNRRIALISELQSANVRLASMRVRLEAVGTKLMYTGMVKSQLAGIGGTRPEIAIVRSENGERRRAAATEDTELAPGDVIEVALARSMMVPSASSNAATR